MKKPCAHVLKKRNKGENIGQPVDFVRGGTIGKVKTLGEARKALGLQLKGQLWVWGTKWREEIHKSGGGTSKDLEGRAVGLIKDLRGQSSPRENGNTVLRLPRHFADSKGGGLQRGRITGGERKGNGQKRYITTKTRRH